MSREETRARILDSARSLIETQGASVSMERIAEKVGISRRAVYLHFDSRSDLLLALVAHVDETGSLSRRAARVWEAPTAAHALDEFVRMNARYNAEIEGVARALDEARQRDEAAREAWNDRMAGRRAGCRRLVRWLSAEAALAKDWSIDSATDFLWAVTNIPYWRDLVVERGWSVRRYERDVGTAVRRALLRQADGTARGARSPHRSPDPCR